MSSSTWTAAALLSNARPASGTCWRIVEAQYINSTTKLTDSLQEQERLERLIDATKPTIPPECRHLNFLLATPFRYGAPYPKGSRFRRAGMTLGVFYGSEIVETAATEMAFYRVLFFAESPATPWPTNASQYTAFSVEYAVGLHINLTRTPLATDRTAWTDPINLAPCQDIAEIARSQEIYVIKYESVRDPRHRTNIALLSCRAFAHSDIGATQTWRIHLSASGARVFCEFPKITLDLPPDTFAKDPRIAAMNWGR
jgi:hypothetical protein